MHKNLVELKENLLVGRQIQQKNNSAGARCCDHGRCDLTETMPQKSFGRNGYCGYTDQRHDQGPCRKPFLGSCRPFYLEYARAGNYLLNFHRRQVHFSSLVTPNTRDYDRTVAGTSTTMQVPTFDRLYLVSNIDICTFDENECSRLIKT